ncbi:MAG: ATP-binding protein [Defluviicoccus sp.]
MATETARIPELMDILTRVYRAAAVARSVRACLLTSRDRDFALNQLKRVSAEQSGIPLYHYSTSSRRQFQRETPNWRTCGGSVQDSCLLLQETRGLRGGGIVVLEDMLELMRENGGRADLRQELAYQLGEHRGDGVVLVFLEAPEAERHLPAMIADQVIRLSVPYPRRDELEGLCREEVAAALRDARQPFDVDQIRRIAPALAEGLVGLTRSAARDALRDALALDTHDFDGALLRLQERKRMQLSRELQMDVLRTEDAGEPVGLDYLVDFLRIHGAGMRRSGRDRARGVLLIGPPGTGKTMLAKCIGKIVELPVVEFRVSSLMNSLLGETERRFQQAFSVLEALSPVLCFIDEIDKIFSDEGGERTGGTMSRVSGAMLSWLSENLHPVYVIATSNSLKRMGEIGSTMTRSERFDSLFFVDVPSREARRQIFVHQLSNRLNGLEIVAADLADITDRFSGADLVSVVKHARARADAAGQSLTRELLVREIERKRARAEALYTEFQPLRAWGRLHCEAAGPTDTL